MKAQTKLIHLQLLTLSAGLLGILLRIVLYTTAMDETGMLLSGHWTRSGLLVLSVLVVLLLAAGCRFLALPAKQPGRPASLAAGFSCFLCAGGFLMNVLTNRPTFNGGTDYVSLVLTLLAAAGLVFIGIHRCIGRTPHYLAHTLVCLSFALQMIGQYRLWSSEPQLSDYCFQMLALVSLMLTSYHWASHDSGAGGDRRLRFYGLLSIFFSLVSVYGSTSGPFMGLCALWVMTNLAGQAANGLRKLGDHCYNQIVNYIEGKPLSGEIRQESLSTIA